MIKNNLASEKNMGSFKKKPVLRTHRVIQITTYTQMHNLSHSANRFRYYCRQYDKKTLKKAKKNTHKRHTHKGTILNTKVTKLTHYKMM